MASFLMYACPHCHQSEIMSVKLPSVCSMVAEFRGMDLWVRKHRVGPTHERRQMYLKMLARVHMVQVTKCERCGNLGHVFQWLNVNSDTTLPVAFILSLT